MTTKDHSFISLNPLINENYFCCMLPHLSNGTNCTLSFTGRQGPCVLAADIFHLRISALWCKLDFPLNRGYLCHDGMERFYSEASGTAKVGERPGGLLIVETADCLNFQRAQKQVGLWNWEHQAVGAWAEHSRTSHSSLLQGCQCRYQTKGNAECGWISETGKWYWDRSS